MAKWRFTAPDGTKYVVEGNDERGAYAALQDRIKQDTREEFSNLPLWQKPVQAASDVARIASNLVTAGYRDKLAGYLGGGTPEEERYKTEKARTRAGSASLGAEMLPMLMVPAMAGASPALAGATEGAVFGGLQAGAHDEPIIPGVLAGAATGGLVGAGSALNTVTRGLPKNAARAAAKELGTLRLKDGLYIGGGAGALGSALTGSVTPGSIATGVGTALGAPVVGALARGAHRAMKPASKKIKEKAAHWDPEVRRLLTMLGLGATQQDE